MVWSYKNNKFLYETIPDFFPHDRLTQIEMDLWARFHDQLKDNKNG